MFARPLSRIALLSILAGACGGGDSVGPQGGGTPTALAAASGDAQTGTVGAQLAQPLIARVTDSRGQPVSGAAVTFTVASGGGSLTATSATTDASGNAQTRWTLGTSATTEQRVEARVGTSTTIAPAVFRATPTAGAATGVSKNAGDAQTGSVGAALTNSLSVKVVDQYGNGVPNVQVTFAVTGGGGSLATPVVTTNASGIATSRWTLGTAPGPNTATATVSGLTAASFTATAVAGPAQNVVITPGSVNVQAGGTRQLSVAVTDAFNNPITGRAITWTTNDAGVVTVDGTGLVTGVCPGNAKVTATVEGKSASIDVGVAGGTVLCPTLSAITPATLVPGAAATLTGSNFSTTPAQNIVKIDGVTAAVTAATSTQLTITVPQRTSFPCEPTHNATVIVTAGAKSAQLKHPLTVGTVRTLAVGESFAVENGTAELRCNELSLATNARYMVAVTNMGGFENVAAFTLRGSNGSALPATAVTVNETSGAARYDALQAVAPRMMDHVRSHQRILEQNRELMARYRPTPGARTGALRTHAAAAAPNVGDTLNFKFPDIDALCTGTPSNVRARVVYVGAKSIVLEDIAAPIAAQMDSFYTALGQEFDNRQLPILTNNFGNVLAYDANTNNDGHMYMLFTPRVNSAGAGNILGFVSSGDLFDPTLCPASNKAEIFYGYVPTEATRGIQSWPGRTRDEWWDYVRSVIIHETKHVISNVERASRGSTPEVLWLEESTAVIAEELYARLIYNLTQGSNADYRASLFCDVRPTNASCASREFSMYDIFSFFYTYLQSNETLSPIGRVSDSDGTWYGSGWSLLRWAADQYANGNEAAFFRALAQEPVLKDLDNLRARTNRSNAEMLSDWALALATDDLNGFTPQRRQLTFPSWNLRDILTGMNRDFPNGFPTASPMKIRTASFGNFSTNVAQVRGGTSAIFDLSGAQTQPQVLELAGNNLGATPTNLRLQIVRVQ